MTIDPDLLDALATLIDLGPYALPARIVWRRARPWIRPFRALVFTGAGVNGLCERIAERLLPVESNAWADACDEQLRERLEAMT